MPRHPFLPQKFCSVLPQQRRNVLLKFFFSPAPARSQSQNSSFSAQRKKDQKKFSHVP
jgi:hypothetical protein